jgi:hypothetical protein
MKPQELTNWVDSIENTIRGIHDPQIQGSLTLLVAGLLEQIKIQEIEIDEWKHRAVGGTCRILSPGSACQCPLCSRDQKLNLLKNKLGQLDKDLTQILDILE